MVLTQMTAIQKGLHCLRRRDRNTICPETMDNIYLLYQYTWNENKRVHGPLFAHLSSCHKERMLTTKFKYHFSMIITKDDQFTKFNLNILSMGDRQNI